MLTLINENSTTGERLLGVLLGPITGLAYIIALPFLSIAAVLALVAGKAVSGITSMAGFGWRPAESYLSGKDKKKKG